MTQTATVRRIVGPKRAEVAVVRASACGHDCTDCGGCKMVHKLPVVTLAENAVGAQAGDRVEVESATARVLGMAAAVYLFPFVLFFLLYFLSDGLGLSQAWSVALGVAGFLSGAGVDILLNRALRRRPRPEVRIVGIRRD